MLILYGYTLRFGPPRPRLTLERPFDSLSTVPEPVPVFNGILFAVQVDDDSAGFALPHDLLLHGI